jgi:hypothetical protein
LFLTSTFRKGRELYKSEYDQRNMIGTIVHVTDSAPSKQHTCAAMPTTRNGEPPTRIMLCQMFITLTSSQCTVVFLRRLGDPKNRVERLLCQKACSPVLRHQVNALARLTCYAHSALEEAEYLQ